MKLMYRVGFNLLLTWILLICSTSILAAESAKDAVKKAYQSWCTAMGVAKGDPQVVVKYYAPDAILLPTLSPKILRNTDGGLDGYFKKLTSYPDIRCSTQELITHLYGDLAINSGFYTFKFKQDGKETRIPARFTFVYQKRGEQWMIVNHHSSEMPEGH